MIPTVDAAETILENQIRVAEISDPAGQKELGRNLAVAAAQEKQNNCKKRRQPVLAAWQRLGLQRTAERDCSAQ